MQRTEKIHEKILAQMDLTRDVEDGELIEVIHRVLNEEAYALSLREKTELGKDLFNTLRKLDILQELIEDEEITEIMINGTRNIFVEKQGRLL